MKEKELPLNTRRNFLKKVTAGMAATLMVPGLGLVSQSCSPERQRQAAAPEANRQLGVALVGLGWYSTDQLGPALLETEYCRLAGVVTGTPESGQRFLKKYKFPEANIYNYDNFDQIADNDDIDIVYLVLPPAMHAEFAIRAMQAGKHVIVEKPMATSVRDAERMLEARDNSGKFLSVGYRVHFDPYHQQVKTLGQENEFGAVTKMQNAFAMYWDRGGWRADRNLGGGSVWDMGTYVIQASIYSIGENPIAVTAREMPKQKPDMFGEVDEGMEYLLEFPGGAVATCKNNLWMDEDLLRAETEQGYFELEPAYDYYGQRGETHEGVIHFGQVNQQALQIDDFARRILANDPATPVPGEMGLRDVRIIEAVYESARTGQRVAINYNEKERDVI